MRQWSIAWWEYEELLEHLTTRPDIWTKEEDSFSWIRMSMRQPEGTPAMRMEVTPPIGSSKFRMAHLTIHPLSWDEEVCESYTRNLLIQWSTYGDRIELQQLYETELSLDPKVAMVAAIVAGHLFTVGTIKDDQLSLGDFHEDAERYDFQPGYLLGQWPLLKGGSIRLLTTGKHTVRAIVHIDSPGDVQDDVELRGFLYPSPPLPFSGLHYKLFGYLGDPYASDTSGSERVDVQPTGPDQRETELD